MATTAPAQPGVSPSSSPRLPSPPPFTEVQFGPKSPSAGASISELELEAAGQQDDGASRRIRPGSKAIDMAKGPPFLPLHQLESAFQLQEYLKTLYHKLTREESSNTIQPVSKEMALELATPPTASDTGETVDRNLWLYELCRFLCSKTTRIIVAFFSDNPPCSSQTCPEMRASEWQYLCAVHEPPKSCCAIDYCNHTLDWASNVLTSTKHFPSRLSLGGEGGNAYQSMRQLTNIFRRVYRIYAHAWFQHREVFWSIEAELGLYMFFKTVCDVYQLIPEDNYTIPPEAEGVPEEKLETPVSVHSPERVQILQKENDSPDHNFSDSRAQTTVSTGATTRRHKHTPSTGIPVPAIAEGPEEDEEPTQILNTELELPPSPKPSTDRLKSPGRITLPENLDPERAPEDPTPIAHHDFNPLSSATNQSKPAPETPPSMPALSTNIPPAIAEEQGERTVISPSGGSFKIGGPDVLDAILGHMDDMDNPKALESDTETVIAASDSGKAEETDEVDNETMEKLEMPISKPDTGSDKQDPDAGQKEEAHINEEPIESKDMNDAAAKE